MAKTPTAPDVVGRRETLAAVERFLTGASGRVLVLEGEPGIGKTTVWLAGIERAEELGHAVLRSRPASVEATLSLAGLVDLVRGTPPTARETLPEIQRRALAAALAEEGETASTADGRLLGAALLSLLRSAAAGSPVLLAIDDLQWLDEASAAVVLYAWRRLGGVDVRLVAACRGDAGAPLPFELERTLAPGSLERVSLAPLSEGAIRRILHLRLGRTYSRVELHALYDAVRGNPLFALELARQGLELDESASARLPLSLHELVAGRLRALPKHARDALLYVAALADPREAVLVEAGVRDALEPVLDAGVLEIDGSRFRFAHPLIGSVAWAEAPESVRRCVHRVLADAVSDGEERARHLAAASDPPDARVAALLEAAAAHAGARGAPAAAAALLDRALDFALPDDLDGWARLARRAAEAHAEAGHWDRVEELVGQAQERLPAGPARAAVLVTATELRPGLDALLRQAAGEAGETPPGIRARIGLAAQATLALDLDEAVERAGEALAAARALGERALLGVALTYLGGLKLLDSRLEGEADVLEARQIEREVGGLPTSVYESPRMWHAAGLLWRDDPDAACVELEESRRTAEVRGDDMSVFQFRNLLVQADAHRGDWSSARSTAQAALDQADSFGYDYGRHVLVSSLALVEADEGEVEQARLLATGALEALTGFGDRLWSTFALAALVRAELLGGDVASAVMHAAELGERFRGRECWWSYHQGDELEALVLAGEHERAAARAADLRRAAAALRLPRFSAWAYRGEAFVHGAAGDLPAAASAFEAALAEHERFTLPFDRARTLLAYGHVLRREAKRRAARAALEEALAEFVRLGARYHARLARDELGHVGGRVPAGEHQLTPAEERVALLVARGMSNKEVAAELFLTVSTVEAALTRIYAKLGLRSRAELASTLAAQAAPER